MKLLIRLFGLILLSTVVGAGCGPSVEIDTNELGCTIENSDKDCKEDGDISITSAKDIEDFCSLGCGTIKSMDIYGMNDVKRLVGFDNIKATAPFGGGILIDGLDGPVFVDVFNGLIDLRGWFEFQDTVTVEEFRGFNKIEDIGGPELNFTMNQSLRYIKAFQNLIINSHSNPEHYIYGGMNITNNPKLKEVAGLPKLRETSRLTVEDNESLETFGSLESLEEIGVLIFSNNPKLRRLPEMPNLRRIHRIFIVENSPHIRACDVQRIYDQLEEPPETEFRAVGLSDEPCD